MKYIIKNEVLILEDDYELAQTIEDFLNVLNLKSKIAQNIEQAINLCSKERFLLYLFDINLPDGNGCELLKELRFADDFTPTIFLTSATSKESVLAGFNSGCDDYVKKPFDLDELGAKIKAILRRSYGYDDSLDVKIDKNITFKPNDGVIVVDGKIISLTNKEKELLALLIINNNSIVSHEEIANKVWDAEFSYGSLRVYISKLKNILQSRLECVRGEGYRLSIKRYV